LTPPHLAAKFATCLSHDLDDSESRTVCDLGCGTGMLTKSSLLAGASYVLGIDIDSQALSVARANCVPDSEGSEDGDDGDDGDADSGAVDFLCADVATWTRGKSRKFDFAVLNPPFGTKRRGIDMFFLCAALNMARIAVYSMHKSSTREFIATRFDKYGVQGEVMAEMKFELPKTYAFQKCKSIDVSVDLWRFDVTNAQVIEMESAGIHVQRPIEVFGGYDTTEGTMRRGGRGRRRGNRGRGRRRK